MRGVVQRVKQADVSVDGNTVGSIGRGILLLLGVGVDDDESDADFVANKVVNLRIFEDQNGKMNRSLLDIDGDLLVVSQFTLLGDSRKGMRPSFIRAAKPDLADELYEYFVKKVAESIARVETGQFRAMMDVGLVNDGPVTILLDSKKAF